MVGGNPRFRHRLCSGPCGSDRSSENPAFMRSRRWRVPRRDEHSRTPLHSVTIRWVISRSGSSDSCLDPRFFLRHPQLFRNRCSKLRCLCKLLSLRENLGLIPLDFRFLFAIVLYGRGNGKQALPAPLPSWLSRAGSRLLINGSRPDIPNPAIPFNRNQKSKIAFTFHRQKPTMKPCPASKSSTCT